MTSVLLLRGINVGGVNILPMAMLREALGAAGAVMPETYIQSGNAVFGGSVSAVDIGREVKARAGFEPAMIVMSAAEYLAVLAANPFGGAEKDPKSLHLYFLPRPSKAGTSDLEAVASAEERVLLTPKVLYLHSPKFLSGSLIAPKLDRILAVRATGRNWRTCERIRAMLERRS